MFYSIYIYYCMRAYGANFVQYSINIKSDKKAHRHSIEIVEENDKMK